VQVSAVDHLTHLLRGFNPIAEIRGQEEPPEPSDTATHPMRRPGRIRKERRMILCFLRHGAADPPESRPDEARRLTPEGRDELGRAAPLLRRLDLRPEIVLTSPRDRAVETARILQAGGLGGELITDQRLAPGMDWRELIAALGDHAQSERLLLVGHEPDLSRAVATLTGGNRVRLREAGLCRVELPPGSQVREGAGVLTLLLDPVLYRDGS
jgi:phosphohistidine phosphatase